MVQHERRVLIITGNIGIQFLASGLTLVFSNELLEKTPLGSIYGVLHSCETVFNNNYQLAYTNLTLVVLSY